MNTKRIISILTTICLVASCFTSMISVSAEEAVIEPISAETVCEAILSTDSTIEVTATQNGANIDVAITSENLKEHLNGAEPPVSGHWAGFAVVAPEGTTHCKYALGTSADIELSAPVAIGAEDVVTQDGKTGVAFYADAGSKDAKTYAKLQWFAGENAISEETTFVMDLDGIVLDGVEKEDISINYLDKKSETVNFCTSIADDVSVDFSKIKMEYYESVYTPMERKTEFGVANVADFNSDDAVYDEGSYKVELIDGYEINIAMKNLKAHTNGNGDEGHWTGFTVKAPEGAKSLHYWKSFGDNNFGNINFEEGQTEESFYINVAEYGDGYNYIDLQWYDENGSAISEYEGYSINLDEVEIAAEAEVSFEEANVCDSFPHIEDAELPVYADYSVETDNNRIKINMTDLVLHRNANKEAGYWTGFTVNGPEAAKQLKYNKTFGNNSYDDKTIPFEGSESFYMDVWECSDVERITIQFLDENGTPITREMRYRIDTSDVTLKFPEEYTITEAVVADYDSADTVYDEGSYDVACESGVIKLSAENLKSHTNGNLDEGHWIGFAVEAPEGATHYTYWFGDAYEYTPVALEDGETSVSFYVNASAPWPKDYLDIRWYCDDAEPESYPYIHEDCYYSYYIDITNVDIDNDAEVTVTAAPIVNQNAPDVAPYTGTPSATVEEDATIKLAVEGLKTHFNGNGDLGAWVGVSVSRPAGAAKVKYSFDDDDYYYSTSYCPADEVADETSVSFYVDAYDETPKNRIEVQWFDENNVAITNNYTYKLDLSGVDYLVADEAELSIEKAPIVDQADPEVDPFRGEYDATLEGDTIKLSADLLMDHMNGADDIGSWIGFKASVEGAKYLKYAFTQDYADWYYDAEQIELSDGSETFYVNAYAPNQKDTVMLQWFDENGTALTNVNTYKIDVEEVTLGYWFQVHYSNIELAGEDARFYNLIPDGERVELVSTADYVYVLTDAENGSVELKVDGIDESNGGNVFYRNAERKVTLVATPDSGYTFYGWYMNGEMVSNASSYEVTLDACYDLSAVFSTVSAGGSSGGGGGSVSVSRPKASVTAGEVEAGTKVELSTTTKDAVIYYTVDGTTPTDKSTEYTEAITVNEDVTIKAIAIKGKAKSSVLTVKYTIKKAAEDEDKPAATPVFTDIANYAWASEAINALAEKGIINGVSDTEYAPANDIKRADFMLLLVRMLDLKAEVADNFDDVTTDKYYYEGVGIAKALGLTTGVGENKFNPEASITRQDMFVLAHRILEMQEIELDEADETAISAFDDYSKIADYAKAGLASLVKNELVEGSDNKINPVGNATRAETAVFVYRLYNLLNK